MVVTTALDGRRLLLKRIPPLVLSDALEIERFRREIRTLVSLELSGVPQIEAFDDDPGSPYLLMEWVEGRSLDQEIRDLREASVQDRTRFALQAGQRLARILAEIHHVGIIHRDLSPRNVMVRPDGTTVLLDFGLARNPQDSLLTVSGDFLGTLRYAPPEQVFASGRMEPSVTGDLYSLGLILAEILVGRPIRDGDSQRAMLRQVLLEEPPDLRSLVPQVPSGLAQVVAALLTRDPRYRYPTATAVADDLAVVEAGSSPLQVPHLPGRKRFARWWHRMNPRKRQRQAVLTATAFLTLTIGGLSWQMLPLRWARQAALSNDPIVALPLLERATSWRVSPELLLQKSFTEAAFSDPTAARGTLEDLEDLQDWKEAAQGISAWLEAVNSPEPQLNSVWQRGEEFGWIDGALNQIVAKHPDHPWLLAWRSWIVLSYNDNLVAMQDLAAATKLAPKALMIRRAEVMAQIEFSQDDRNLPFIEQAEEAVPNPEWSLWRSYRWNRLGKHELARQSAAEAGEGLRVGHPLQARVEVESRLSQAGLRVASESDTWLPTRDFATLTRRRECEWIQGDPISMVDPDNFLVLGTNIVYLRGDWRNWAATPPPGVAFLTDHGEGLQCNFQDWGEVLHWFGFTGDGYLVRFAEEGMTMLPPPGPLEEVRQHKPRFLSRKPVFPSGDWMLEVELKWQGAGDYGSGIRLTPGIHFFRSQGIQLKVGRTIMAPRVTDDWRHLRIESRKGRYTVALDGQVLLEDFAVAVPAPREILLGSAAPVFSPRVTFRALSVSRID